MALPVRGRPRPAEGTALSLGCGSEGFPEADMLDVIDVILHLLINLEYLRSWCLCAYVWVLARLTV